jgi:predicted ribosomally synthesized peptide with nif11-like leader
MTMYGREAESVSQEKAREFIRKAGTEKSLSGMLDNVKSKEDLLNAAKSLGYDFTIEELRRAIVQIMDLDDTELDAVTGGTEVFGYGRVFSLINMLGLKSSD